MVNPYQSPDATTSGGSLHTGGLCPGARATLVAHGLLYRRLVIDAPIEATLTFNGRSLYDTVTIDQSSYPGLRLSLRDDTCPGLV